MADNKPMVNEEFMQRMFKRQVESKLKLFADLNRTAKKQGVLFVGDSITEGYPLHELFIDKTNIYNRGIGGITSSFILENMQTMVLDLEPGTIFLLIGTNDLFFEATPQQVSENIATICSTVREKLPETMIYVLSVYPIDTETPYEGIVQGPRSNSGILEINRLVEETLPWSDRLKYLDLHTVLKGSTGHLRPEYTVDGLHLSVNGYHKVSEVIGQYL